MSILKVKENNEWKGIASIKGEGVPVGGTTGQVLAKKSGADFDTEWIEQSGGGGGTSNYNSLTNKPIEIEFNKTGLIVDNVTKFTFATTPTVTTPKFPIALFGRNMGSSIGSCKAKFWYFQAYEGETLALDLVPCYRKSDSEIGMYDTVSGTFYTNSGQGTFTKGGDIN